MPEGEKPRVNFVGWLEQHLVWQSVAYSHFELIGDLLGSKSDPSAVECQNGVLPLL